MARTFVTEVSNAEEAFSRLRAWADDNGYFIKGNATKGTFKGTPSGVAGFLIGEISGAYAVSGSTVTIQVNKDLPTGPVANALSKRGMKFVKAE